jgi:prevent-host-death family protein
MHPRLASPERNPFVKTASLADVKNQLSRYLREASHEQVVITKHGKPAGVLIGFESEDDWFDYRLENDPRFLKRIARARASLRANKGISWEDVQKEEDRRTTSSAARCAARR